MSKAAQKKAEAAKFEARVKSVLVDAHAAAKAAYEDFANTADRTPEGHIKDSCGGGYVVVYKPSYRLRTTLKKMNEIIQGYGGGWHVSHFTKEVHSQSVTAGVKAAEAAREILHREFGLTDGEFYTESYID
ncbi:hypothetical protein [Mesorhizobium sp. M0500]|uniref:hypothetical protein n=1 Tax=unclassified Mesorhizobium TaxID=325217 RepID=UPI00333AEBBC